MTNLSVEIEGGNEAELTANPNADALCLKKDTAVKRERESTFLLGCNKHVHFLCLCTNKYKVILWIEKNETTRIYLYWDEVNP